MFSQSKYTKWYYNIVNNAKSRISEEYSEKHHIIPKSLGGSNHIENLVLLSAREHFICHWLLTKMVVGTKEKYQMWNAFSCMLYRENGNQQRYKINSRAFDLIKKQGALIKSAKWSGKGNPMFGKKGELSPLFGRKQSPEHVETLRKIKTGKTRSEESKRKQSLSSKGKKQNSEWIEKRKLFGSSNGMFGKKLSPETIAKRTATLKANKLAKKLAKGEI